MIKKQLPVIIKQNIGCGQSLLCCFYCFAPNFKVFRKNSFPVLSSGSLHILYSPWRCYVISLRFPVCLKFHSSLPRILSIVRTIELLFVMFLLFPLRSVSSILQPFYGVQGIRKCGEGSLFKVLTRKAVEILTLSLFRTTFVMILTFLNYQH